MMQTDISPGDAQNGVLVPSAFSAHFPQLCLFLHFFPNGAFSSRRNCHLSAPFVFLCSLVDMIDADNFSESYLGPDGLFESKRRTKVKCACVSCKHAKTACDQQRPCQRCICLGIQDRVVIAKPKNEEGKAGSFIGAVSGAHGVDLIDRRKRSPLDQSAPDISTEFSVVTGVPVWSDLDGASPTLLGLSSDEATSGSSPVDSTAQMQIDQSGQPLLDAFCADDTSQAPFATRVQSQLPLHQQHQHQHQQHQQQHQQQPLSPLPRARRQHTSSPSSGTLQQQQQQQQAQAAFARLRELDASLDDVMRGGLAAWSALVPQYQGEVARMMRPSEVLQQSYIKIGESLCTLRRLAIKGYGAVSTSVINFIAYALLHIPFALQLVSCCLCIVLR